VTPEALAALHARAFTVPRPYSAAEFAAFLDDPRVFLLAAPTGHELGFALGRAAADEAELLTLAVSPERRRQGMGRALLDRFEDAARTRGATAAFLEVAAGNAAARALYASAGYRQTGRRPGYYRGARGAAEDALILTKPLNPAPLGG